MNEWLVFLPMFLMGLISSGHCIGMCGGIMGALTLAIPASATHKRWGILLAYNVGRITSYSLMGLLVGIFTQMLFNGQLGAPVNGSLLRVLAGCLLIMMGLYLADWWRGLTYLESLGRYLWVYIQPLGKNLFPVVNLPKAFLLGTIWGWLPCGLVYSALVLAMAQSAPWLAAGSMLAFGLGTLPMVLVAGVAAQQIARFLQQRPIRFSLALLIIIYGLWTIYGGLGNSHSGLGNSVDHHHHI
ncbi:MAG: sulfite exporter TauE/SafE family protein [Pseudomonadota bacterium]